MSAETRRRLRALVLCILLISSSVAVSTPVSATASGNDTDDGISTAAGNDADDAMAADAAGGVATFRINYSVSTTVTAIDTAHTTNATVTNTGNASGSTSVPFVVGEDVVGEKSVTLSPGETTSVSFRTTFVQPGQHTINIADNEPTTVTVGSRLFDKTSVSTFELNPQLDAWNRFLFPFRTSSAGLTTRIDNRQRQISQSGDLLGFNKDTVGTYSVDESVEFSFDPGRAQRPAGSFERVPVQLVAVRLSGSQNLSVATIENIATGGGAAASEVVESDVFDSDGTATFEYTPSTSGKYILFLASPSDPGSELTAEGTGFDVTGNMTLLGFETFTVERATSDVTPETSSKLSGSVIRGNDVTFRTTVDAPADERVHHLVILYDNETFSNSVETTVIEGSLSVGAISEQTKITGNIGNVNGVRRIEDEFVIAGVDFTNDELSRVQGLGSAIDFLTESPGRRPPGTTDAGNTVLDASVTAKTGAPAEAITVETNREFSPGTYRWIHLARVSGTTRTEASTGGITVVDGTELQLSVNRTTAVAGESVRLSVARTDTDAPVNTTVRIGDRTVRTGSDGIVRTQLAQVGSLTVRAVPPTPSFYPAQAEIEVDPLELSLTANQTAPVAGAPVQFTTRRTDTNDVVNATISINGQRLSTGADGTLTYTFTEPGKTTVRATSPSATFSDTTTTIDIQSPADITVKKYSVSTTQIQAGETVNVDVTVRNNGDVAGETSVLLTVADIAIEQNQTVTVEGGATRDIEFAVEIPQPGEYNLTVGDAQPTPIGVKASLPYRNTFANGPAGWEIQSGTGGWTNQFDGSVRLATGTDTRGRLQRKLGPLTAGTRVQINYTQASLTDANGTITAVLAPDSATPVVLDTDGAADRNNGTLTGVVPRQIDASDETAILISGSSGQSEVYIQSVALEAPPTLRLYATRDGRRFPSPNFVEVTANQTITLVAQNIDAGQPVNGTLTVSGDIPIDTTEPRTPTERFYNQNLTLTDGTAQWTVPASGIYDVSIYRPTLNEEVFGDGSDDIFIEATRQEVRLDVDANRTTVPDQGRARFTVTRADTQEPVNATVRIDTDTQTRFIQTGADGTITHQFTEPGETVVTAFKSETFSTEFKQTVTPINVAPAVEIDEFRVRSQDNTTVRVSFISNRTLENISATVFARDAEVRRTLTQFDRTPTIKGFRYQAQLNATAGNVYTATLRRAETARGKGGATNQRSGIALVAPGQTNLTVPATTTTPTTDGRLDDLAWRDAANYNLSFSNTPGDQTVTARVRLLHDTEYIYIGINSALGRVDDSFGRASRSKVLLDANSDRRLNGSTTLPHRDISISQSGPFADTRFSEYSVFGTDQRSPPPGVKSASNRQTASEPVTYEYRIPFDALGVRSGDNVGLEIVIHDDQPGRDNAYYWAFQPDSGYSVTERAQDWPRLELEPPTLSPRFSYSPNAPTVGQSVVFDASKTSIDAGNITSYQWDVDGDGTADGTGEQFDYTFTNSGSYDVELRAVTAGNRSDTAVKRIEVTAGTPVTAPFTERFTQNARGWTVVPARARQTDSNITNTWTAQFDGSVALTTTSRLNQSTVSRQVRNIERGDEIGAAILAAPRTDRSGTVSLVLSSSTSNERAVIDQIEYNQTTTGPQLLSGFAPARVAGDARLKVIHETAYTQSIVYVSGITVQDGVAPPTPSVQIGPAAPTVGQQVTLDASESTDPDGNLQNATIEWYFGSDGQVDATGLVVNRSFSSIGGQNVRLKITDEDGQSTVIRRHFTVRPVNTTIVFADDFEDDPIGSQPNEWDKEGFANQRVVASTAASGNRSLRLAPTIFGREAIIDRQLTSPANGTVVIKADVRVEFTQSNRHRTSVDIDLRDDPYDGFSSNRVQLLAFRDDGTIVGSGEPIGSFAGNQFEWLTFKLRYSRADDAVQVTYRQGGDVLATVTREAESYEDALSYLVLSSGDAPVYYDDIVVATEQQSPIQATNNAPTASITVNRSEVAAGEAVRFTANSSVDSDGQIAVYAWDFDGDGDTDTTGTVVRRSFTQTGTQEISLRVIDDGLKAATTTTSVNVSPADSIAPFSRTEPLAASTVSPPDIADDIRVEAAVQQNTTVQITEQSPSDTKFTVQTGSASNTTVYVRRSVLPTDATVSELLFAVNGQPAEYYIEPTLGASGDTWVAVSIPTANATLRFTSDDDPIISANVQSTGNYVNNPVRFRVQATDPNDRLQTSSYQLPSGTTVSLRSQQQTNFTRLVNITVGQSTWNDSQSRYTAANVTFYVTDEENQQARVRVPVTVYIQGDTTGDGVVDIFDAVVISRHYNTTTGESDYRSAADINNDGVIDIEDAVLAGRAWDDDASSLEEG